MGALLLPLTVRIASAASTDLNVYSDGVATWGLQTFRCALGGRGVTRQKREGDLATPVGAWPLRRLLYRADRIAQPVTRLPVQRLTPSDGWSDDARDPQYNRPVTLPRATSAEALWRSDHLYDVIVPVGYNDGPIVPGAGSAIFIHVARENYAGTAGCVAFRLEDLLTILSTATTATRLVVNEDIRGR
jgi:L,D-peptidoglycan transpeptidase YkuD (ErfK/YbiS/YcfS/YnhG family)